MNKNKILSHIGLALVTYGALIIYIIFLLILSVINNGDSGLAFNSNFFGYFATFMTFFGWILIIPALIISIRGLMRKEDVAINYVTLACSLGWFVIGYWVMTHFA